MYLPHKIQYDILQKLCFYFGKNANFYFRIFCEVSEFCVVAKRSFAFFGVCSFGCTHFFILGDVLMLKELLERADCTNIVEFIMNGCELAESPKEQTNE